MKHWVLVLGIAMLMAGASAPCCQAERTPFTLTIVPNENQEQDKVCHIDMGSRFYAVLANVSGTPKRIYEDWSSWGDNLRFELTDRKGAKIIVYPDRVLYRRNYPAVFKIPAGGFYVFCVTWDTDNYSCLRKFFDAAGDSSPKVTLKAIYREKPSKSKEDALIGNDPVKRKIWAGSVESKPLEVELND